MQNEYEIVPHKKIKHINIFLNKITYRSFHLHNDFELLCVLSGEGTITTVKRKYDVKSGSIIILNSSELHEIVSDRNGITILIFQISNHLLREYYPEIRNAVFSEGNVNEYLNDDEINCFLSNAKQAAVSYISQEPLFELECISSVSKMMSMLFKAMPSEILNEKAYTQKKKQSKRIDRIFSYIDLNYQTAVRLQDVAEIESISPTHLSHIFTDFFGVTFQEYLNSVRFEHALRMIANKSFSISEVAQASGFSELKYMTKMFEKRLGMKPKKFREEITLAEQTNQRPTSVLEYILPDAEALKILNNMQLI